MAFSFCGKGQAFFAPNSPYQNAIPEPIDTIGHRLDSTHYFYDDDLSTRMLWQYDANGVLQQELVLEMSSGKISTTTKTAYNYNSSGLEAIRTKYTLNHYNGVYSGIIKTSWQYNSQNQIVKAVDSTKQTINGVWQYDGYTEYSYSASNKLSLVQEFDVDSILERDRKYLYDSLDRFLSLYARDLTISDHRTRITHTLDSLGRRILSISERYNGNAREFDTMQIETFEYLSDSSIGYKKWFKAQFFLDLELESNHTIHLDSLGNFKYIDGLSDGAQTVSSRTYNYHHKIASTYMPPSMVYLQEMHGLFYDNFVFNYITLEWESTRTFTPRYQEKERMKYFYSDYVTRVADKPGQNERLLFYPNPANENITIVGLPNSTYEIYTTNGLNVTNLVLFENNVANVSQLATGVYLVVGTNEKLRVTARFVKY